MDMRRLLPILLIAFAAVSCSTTRALPEGESRLVSNKVSFTAPCELSAGDITPYLQQNPPSSFLTAINPFVYIYNWSDGSGSGMDRFLRKLGTAPMTYTPSAVAGSCSNIENHLAYEGYYGSEVSANVRTEGRKTYVEYVITPGRRYRISSIAYELPEEGSIGAEFRSDLDNSLVREGEYLSEKLLDRESERGTSFFRDRGYYDFGKNHYSFVADTLAGDGMASLDYCIRNYTRNEDPSAARPLTKYRIGEVKVSYPEGMKVRTSLLSGLNTLHSGDLYSAREVATTFSRISSVKSFTGVGIELSPRDSALVDCNIRISESDLKGFKVQLEASTNSSGLVGISPQLSFYHKNLFGGGEWFKIGFTGNFQFRLDNSVRSNEFGISTGLSLPGLMIAPISRFHGNDIPRTEINVAYNFYDRIEYSRDMATFSFGYSGSFADKGIYYQIYPLRVNAVKLKDIGDMFYDYLLKNPYLYYTFTDHFDAGLSAVLYHTTDSDVVPKSSYRSQRLTLDLSGNILKLLSVDEVFGLPTSQYVKAQLELTRALRFGRNDGSALVGHLLAGAGYAFGYSTAVPFEKQFYAGGAYGMRAWQARSLGPGASEMSDFFSIPSQTGDIKLEADLEYRFSIVGPLEGALFAEIGNIWNTWDFNIGDIAADWGLGLRLDLSFLLLRLDYGIKLYDPSLADGLRWFGPDRWLRHNSGSFHFGVGYPF